MKISNLLIENKPKLSFEVFPPKNWDAYESVEQTTEEIAELKPSYMSVTYGAGGGTSDTTVSIAANIQNKFGVPTLAHLTCLSSDREKVSKQLELLRASGINNILALRGDVPSDFDRSNLCYHYACELIEDIKKAGDFCIGGACYPEGHPESPTYAEDIKHLKEKVDAGCEFLTTQMFFDNDVLYNFMYKIREAGIGVPVVAGIMPVVNPKSIKRTCAISGSALPARFLRIVDKYGDDPDAMKQAGIAYATEQIIDLYANGISNVHVYCMNKPDVARSIMNNISAIIK
ncbi:MAG: methylenetetrahydrofolate reductase [NAD(P)H] [Ruminococcaceae bacterium]|nr:methylenetetrahydrofolate reductase [NAD(P)H] [Oscillospiraceae bacterium]